MSGTRCIIEWRPKIPNMTEEVLVAHGVNMDRVKEGILKMAAAVLQRSVEDVALLPDDPSEYMPAGLPSVKPESRTSVRFVSIYVQESDVTVSIYKLGDYPPIISTEEIAIDWNQFRHGIQLLLRNYIRVNYEHNSAIRRLFNTLRRVALSVGIHAETNKAMIRTELLELLEIAKNAASQAGCASPGNGVG